MCRLHVRERSRGGVGRKRRRLRGWGLGAGGWGRGKGRRVRWEGQKRTVLLRLSRRMLLHAEIDEPPDKGVEVGVEDETLEGEADVAAHNLLEESVGHNHDL